MIPTLDRLALKLAIGIAAALLLALLLHDRNHWKAKTAHYAEILAGERAAHAATVATYRSAAEQARRDDAANIARVRAAQSAINERTSHDLESRLAFARAAARRLRGNPEAGPADSGSRRSAPVPGLPVASRGVAEAAGEDRLPPAERLIATEQAIQLDELIGWVREQAAVERSGD